MSLADLRHPLAVLAAVTLVACSPLYLPPVPGSLPEIAPTLLLSEVRVETPEARGAGAGEAPELAFAVDEIPADGFLAVQWFPPTGGEVASGSVWLDEAAVGTTQRLAFPDDVPRDRAGRWRAVLSWQGRIVRQVAWTEPGP